jgi:hypothetical protein
MNVHARILRLRHNSSLMDALKLEIAAVAARLIVEEGMEFAAAKRKAIKEMGLSARTVLPDSEMVQVAVENYIAEYCADTQPAELLVLRQLALQWMQRLQVFRPFIGGAVWQGSATRHSDIYLQLFCDDPKSTEIFLIDNNIRYQPGSVTGLHGDRVDAISIHVMCIEFQSYVGVHLLIYDVDDQRSLPHQDARGRKARGDAAALLNLLEDNEP